MEVDLNLLERWLTGWSLARGVPLPQRRDGGLVVEVGWPEQLRRHVFVDAGAALTACAAQIQVPFIHLKAAVMTDQLRHALPARWQLQAPGYLMYRSAAMDKAVLLPPGLIEHQDAEHGATRIRFIDSRGEIAAAGRVVIKHGTAVFDRIETLESYRRTGLGTVMMAKLDAVAQHAGACERLLVATDAGSQLYLNLGWQILSPYSTGQLPAPLSLRHQ